MGCMRHKGFEHIDSFSPCVYFNLDNGHSFFKERVKKLEDENHDVTDWKSACEKAMLWGDTIYTGLFLQVGTQESLDQREPVLDQGGPLSSRELGISNEQAERIIKVML